MMLNQAKLLSQVTDGMGHVYVLTRKLTIFIYLLGILSLGQLLGAPAVWATSEMTFTADASELFETHCAGCHVGGGNIIRRGKNLKLKTLKRHQLDQVEAIAQIVTQGQGIMSAYSDRLSAAEIDAVSEYVLEQANAGW